MEISSFPDEILLGIFFHLNYEEIKRVIPLVCRRWGRLSRDAAFGSSCIVQDIKKVTSEGTSYSFVISRITQRGPKLKCFIVKKKLSCDVSDLINIISFKCPNLEILCLVSSVRVTETSLNLLIKRCPNISRLTLHTVSLSNCINVSELRHLNHLKFKGVAFIFDQRCHAVLCHIVDRCRELVELTVKYSRWRTETFKYVVRNIPGIKLNGLGLDVDHDSDSLKLLSSCTSLETLTLGLRECPKNEDSWFQLFTDMERMRYLKVHNCFEIPIDTFNKMISGCPFRNLQVLKLGGLTNGTDSSLEIIAHQFPALTEFALYECPNVTDRGLDEFFSKCSRLETVKLSFLGPNVRGKCLEDLPQKLQFLKVLKVCACDEVSRELVEALGRDNPGLFLCLTEEVLHWQTAKPMYILNIMHGDSIQWENFTVTEKIIAKYPNLSALRSLE